MTPGRITQEKHSVKAKWAELGPGRMRLVRAGSSAAGLALSADITVQPAQGAKVLAKLPHKIVDQGPDGRTQPQVIMSNPEISALSEGQDKLRVVRGMMS